MGGDFLQLLIDNYLDLKKKYKKYYNLKEMSRMEKNNNQRKKTIIIFYNLKEMTKMI